MTERLPTIPKLTSPKLEIRKSKRKRVPTKHLVYQGKSKVTDETHAIKSGGKRKGSKAGRVSGPSAQSSSGTTGPRVTQLVRKTYDRVKRSHASRRAAEVKAAWAENVEKVG
jgi:hypothetical protein